MVRSSSSGKGGDRAAKVAGIRLSHPYRVLYPKQEVTKLALARYYEQAAEFILPHLAGRPVMLARCPRGRGGKCFYQKHVTDSLPDTVRGVDIREKAEERRYIVIDDLAGIVSMVQLGCLEFHPWNCRADKVEKPDRMIFDFDPGQGVDWKEVVAAARNLRVLLEDELELRCFVRTSGGKGLHVVVPLLRTSGWEELKTFAGGVAKVLVDRHPGRFVATMSKSKRRGKVFVDYFRNTRGATAICSYSTRESKGAPVAVPLRWEELTGLEAANVYTVTNVPRRLQALREDPWQDFFSLRQSLSRRRTDRLARLSPDG